MNHVEEQRNELEALSEIYYNEIKIISDKPPISFSIRVRQQAANIEEYTIGNNSEGEDDESEEDDDSDQDSDGDNTGPSNQQGPSIELRFDLPPKYPEEKPSIQILDYKNLEEHEVSKLLDDLSQKAEESLGTVMIFTLVSDLVEWLTSISEKEAVELVQEKEKKQQEIEAEEQKRFDGTPVTVQSFLAWKAKFDAELLKAKLEEQKQQTESGSGTGRRLTGREMFETDKALAESDLNFVEDLDQNQIEALLHNFDEIEIQDDDDDEGEDFELDDEDLEDEDDEDSE